MLNQFLHACDVIICASGQDGPILGDQAIRRQVKMTIVLLHFLRVLSLKRALAKHFKSILKECHFNFSGS